MTSDYIAIESPAWLWILAVFALMAFGGMASALLWLVLKRATLKKTDALIRTEMVKEVGAHHERIEALERELARVIDGMPPDARPTQKSPAPA